MNFKKYWLNFTDKFGNTPVHPQYIMKRYELAAILENKSQIKGDLIDLGCGTMPYRKILLKWVKSYTSLDNPKTFDKFSSNGKPDIFADINNLPIQNNKYDTVLILQVLEHLYNPKKALDESARILKKGGYLILTVPFSYPLHDLPNDYFRYSEVALKKLVIDAGLKVTNIYAQGSFWESWFLSLIMYLMTRIRDLAQKKKNILEVIYVAILILLALIIIFLVNLLFFLLNLMKIKIGQYKNYSPINYVVVARK